MKISVVIPAKNENRFLEKTLQSIEPAANIIVVDDGSSDGTPDIARKYTKNVISLPDIGMNAVNKPHLAEVINTGLSHCRDSDYVCILGADHVLSENYVSVIADRMKRDNAVIASGMIDGEFISEDFPWGSGRVIDCNFFKEIGFKYIEKVGWEDWLIYKALEMGKKVRCYTDISTHFQRPMSFRGKGEIMYALGYYWPYALGRCIKVFLHSPSDGLNMLRGYLLHKKVERLDIAPWVNRHQRMRIRKGLR